MVYRKFLKSQLIKVQIYAHLQKEDPSVPDGPFLLGNCSLQRINVYKYLSVLLSQDISWSPHVQTEEDP